MDDHAPVPDPDDGYTDADKENPNERPTPIPVNPDGIDQKLISYPHWVCWRFEWDSDRGNKDDETDGEWTKIPINPRTGRNAKSSEPTKATAFQQALEYHGREDTDTDGLGFVVTDSPFSGADCDGVYNPASREFSEIGQDVLDTLDSYSEFSPGARGTRTFVVGDLPEGGRKNDPVELYDTGRYLTVTGWRIDETPGEIANRGVGEKVLAEVHRKYFPGDYTEETDTATETETETHTDKEAVSTVPNTGRGHSELADDELIERAKNAENGRKFSQLWNGNTAWYNSHSEADLALCGLLAFWTGGDHSQVDRLFRQSALMRGKWDEDRGTQTYGERTISKALDGRTEFYDPAAGASAPSDGGAATASENPGDDQWDGIRMQYVEQSRDGRLAATERLQQTRDWMYVLEEDHLWVYDEETGVYQPWGEAQAASLLEGGLGEYYRQYELNEIVARLKARNQVHRSELNGGQHAGYHLCVGNGVVDLETGDFLDHDPKYRFTRGLSHEWTPESESDSDRNAILDFLDDITQREADRDTIIDHLAHGLMPGHPYRAFVMLYGPGGNGKTQLGQLLRGFVGDENAASVELPDLTGGDDYATGALPGKFLNVGDDVSVGEIRDTSVLKTATGGGTLRSNEKFEKQFDFMNESAMFFSANEPPRIAEDKESISDRLYPIEMPYQFKAESELDPDNPHHKPKTPRIAEKLLEDPAAMRGLLDLCIEHAQRLVETDGQYSMPEGPAERQLIYESASDPILRFVQWCFVESGNRNDAILKDDAYDVYRELCASEDERITNEDAFKRAITQQSVVDVEAGQSRQLTADGDREPCWRYVSFGDDATAYMPQRLQERYNVHDDGGEAVGGDDVEEQDITTKERQMHNAVPVMSAAESTTGYVSVTVDIAGTREISDTGVQGVMKDVSGAMDVVAWDGDLPQQLFEAEGATVLIADAEVTEYDGTRQLSLVDGLSEIRTVEPGTGHTEPPEAVESDPQSNGGGGGAPTIQSQEGEPEPESSDDAENDDRHEEILRKQTRKTILNTVEKLETRDDPALIADVTDDVIHSDRKARHVIQKLLDAGALLPAEPNGEGGPTSVRTV